MVVHASLHNASPASLAADNVGSPSRPLPSPSVRPRTSSYVPGVPCATPRFCGVQLLHNIPPDRKQHSRLKPWSPLPGAGTVRLTRFLEMPRDQYYAPVNAMITAGRFNHIGQANSLGCLASHRPLACIPRCLSLALWSAGSPSQSRTHIPWRGFSGDPVLAASVRRLDFRFYQTSSLYSTHQLA